MRTSIFLVLAAGALLPARAQSVYGIQGPIGRVWEMTGPSVSMCNYPDGPIGSSLLYAVAGACPAPTPVAFVPGAGVAALMGDVAVDRENDLVYVTDGAAVAAYDAVTGALQVNFTVGFLGLNPPLTGLGWDGSNGWLWVSDAFGYAALQPNGTCMPVAQLAFQAAPAGVGALSDIDVDPQTGEVWVCDAGGQVAHFVAGAAVPNNVIGVAGALPCGFMGMPLLGLCIDTSSPAGTFIVTDGVTVARLAETGAFAFGVAVPRFALPQGCWPAPPGGPLSGLGFSARPVTYGAGMGPKLDALGHATLPSPNFAVTLQGAPAGLVAIAYDFGVACPALALGGAPLYLPLSPQWGFIGPFAIAGNLTLPAALPAPGVLPAGLTIHLQALMNAGGAWSTSNGLAFTTALP